MSPPTTFVDYENRIAEAEKTITKLNEQIDQQARVAISLQNIIVNFNECLEKYLAENYPDKNLKFKPEVRKIFKEVTNVHQQEAKDRLQRTSESPESLQHRKN